MLGSSWDVETMCLVALTNQINAWNFGLNFLSGYFIVYFIFFKKQLWQQLMILLWYFHTRFKVVTSHMILKIGFNYCYLRSDAVFNWVKTLPANDIYAWTCIIKQFNWNNVKSWIKIHDACGMMIAILLVLLLITFNNIFNYCCALLTKGSFFHRFFLGQLTPWYACPKECQPRYPHLEIIIR